MCALIKISIWSFTVSETNAYSCYLRQLNYLLCVKGRVYLSALRAIKLNPSHNIQLSPTVDNK